jgi:hypothetical protein
MDILTVEQVKKKETIEIDILLVIIMIPQKNVPYRNQFVFIFIKV